MGTDNNKKIDTLVLNRAIIESLPFNARQIFSVLEREKDVIIKGGVVKLAVMYFLEKKGLFKNPRRLAAESRIKDIDLDFIVIGNVANARQRVVEKFNHLQTAFAESGIYLDAKDIEIIEAGSWAGGVEKIIERNDLIMNEVAMDYFNGCWRLYYTLRAFRNLIDGIGVLNPKQGHILYNAGRVIPSALGIVRLIKFLVAGKADKIYFPKWWRSLYMENFQNKIKTGEANVCAILGFYSLVLMKNYFGENPVLQKKAMVVLYDLGFTDLLDPDLYIRQQEQAFKDAGNRFEQTEFSIDEIIDRYLENKQKREEGQKIRRLKKSQCMHKFEEINCDLCGENRCVIENCVKCGKNKTGMLPPCSLRMFAGQTDPDGFYEIK